VRMFSFTGDTVLDPFMGTGTTLLACARSGRNAIGVELEPEYIAIARRRLEEQLELFRECDLEVTGKSVPDISLQVA